MSIRPPSSGVNLLVILFLLVSFGFIVDCSDTIDKSPVSSIPDSDIPTDDITPVSSGGNGLQIKGGSVESNRVVLYLRFETDKYKDQDIWIRLSSIDSSYTFQEILNREPNNFIRDITYEYTLGNLVSNTEYKAWMVWQYFSEIEQVEVTFTTLSE